ncbi:MAG: alpha/beta fold hydrolase [Ignavibacteria bacterium]|jgi:pimeloyl-ACP methyl ester carboxylesterase/rhodanese-related sulfurtransferase
MRKSLLVIGFIILCNAFGLAQNNTSGELKTGYIDIGKAKIYYEEKGEGVPLIMIHGGFINRKMWDDQFDYFSKDYRVIRYDVRNHGLTTSDLDVYTNYDDLNNIMEKLKIDKAVIMGLSMGGMITIDFAIAHPEKVIAIIPVSTGLSGFDKKDKDWQNFEKNVNRAFEKEDNELATEYMLRSWTDGPKRTPEQMDKILREKVKTMLLETFEKWDSRIRLQKLSPPAVDRLSEIKVPVLTIYGDIDMQGIIDIADKIEKEIPLSKKYIIKNAAHMVNMEFPDEFNEIVSKFLGNLKFDISTEQAEKMFGENIGNPDFVILDVRTPEEYSAGHITNAVNLDFKSSDFSEKLDELNKNKIYIVYCKGGGRSAKALEIMQKKGFTNVYNVLGGIKKWKEENRKFEIK